jgi:hypothetical protein
MERPDAADLAQRLARNAEAVCRHYLANGRRQGRYWVVGDVRNAPGRSMFVRLSGPDDGPGAAGHWRDYVARWVMLRPGAGRLFCRIPAGSAQHNLSLRGAA